MKTINYQPITKALSILELTKDMLDASREQLETMQQVKDKPYLLGDALINRSLKSYTAQNEEIDVFLQQCAIWRKEKLNEVNLYQVQEIESCICLLKDVNDQIISIANYCKDFTMDEILEKDNLELALDILLRKIPFHRED